MAQLACEECSNTDAQSSPASLPNKCSFLIVAISLVGRSVEAPTIARDVSLVAMIRIMPSFSTLSSANVRWDADYQDFGVRLTLKQVTSSKLRRGPGGPAVPPAPGWPFIEKPRSKSAYLP